MVAEASMLILSIIIWFYLQITPNKKADRPMAVSLLYQTKKEIFHKREKEKIVFCAHLLLRVVSSSRENYFKRDYLREERFERGKSLLGTPPFH